MERLIRNILRIMSIVNKYLESLGDHLSILSTLKQKEWVRPFTEQEVLTVIKGLNSEGPLGSDKI